MGAEGLKRSPYREGDVIEFPEYENGRGESVQESVQLNGIHLELANAVHDAALDRVDAAVPHVTLTVAMDPHDLDGLTLVSPHRVRITIERLPDTDEALQSQERA